MTATYVLHGIRVFTQNERDQTRETETRKKRLIPKSKAQHDGADINLRYLGGGTGGSQFKVCVSSREFKASLENFVSLNKT